SSSYVPFHHFHSFPTRRSSELYAVCLKSDNRAIGAIELKLNGHTDMTKRDDECELGYWIGKPFWGQGLIPEASREMLRRAFVDLDRKSTRLNSSHVSISYAVFC